MNGRSTWELLSVIKNLGRIETQHEWFESIDEGDKMNQKPVDVVWKTEKQRGTS